MRAANQVRVSQAGPRRGTLPGDDTGDEEGGKADKRSSDCTNTDGRTKDPETNSDSEGGSHDLLITAHGAELLKLLLGLDRGFGGVLDLRRVEDVEDERDSDEADNTRNGRSQCPLAPGNGLANGGGGKVHGQRVSSHRSDEHAGGDGGGLEDGSHHVRAHLLLSAFVGLRAACDTERLGERKEDTARTGSKRGMAGARSASEKTREYVRPRVDLPKMDTMMYAMRLPRPVLMKPRARKNARAISQGISEEKALNAAAKGRRPVTIETPRPIMAVAPRGRGCEQKWKGNLLTNFPMRIFDFEGLAGTGYADSRW